MVRIDFSNVLGMLDNFDSQHFRGDFKHTNETVGVVFLKLFLNHNFLEAAALMAN